MIDIDKYNDVVTRSGLTHEELANALGMPYRYYISSLEDEEHIGFTAYRLIVLFKILRLNNSQITSIFFAEKVD